MWFKDFFYLEIYGDMMSRIGLPTIMLLDLFVLPFSRDELILIQKFPGERADSHRAKTLARIKFFNK